MEVSIIGSKQCRASSAKAMTWNAYNAIDEMDAHFMKEDGARGEETKLAVEDIQDRRSTVDLDAPGL